MKTRTFLIGVFVLTVTSSVFAAPQLEPTLAVCKADLKAWSAQKTESLTIKQIDERMNEMYACAERTKKHEKKMRAYLDEFYRTHSELADRAFDFIMRHSLQEQFGQEENAAIARTKPDPAQ